MGILGKTLLTITDVTRMGGRRVCVAGVNQSGESIRPIFKNGIFEDWLYSGGIPIIRPFAQVYFKLLTPEPDPPHTEDWYIEPGYKEMLGILYMSTRKSFLDGICYQSVESIFETKINQDPGYFIKHGEGKRSLGTIKMTSFINFSYCTYNDKWDYRIQFADSKNIFYKLKITDLSLMNFVDNLRIKENLSPEKISEHLNKLFSTASIYLRIGLARHWDKFPGFCFLQVTGVYTFPDYLDGRCFADFSNS